MMDISPQPVSIPRRTRLRDFGAFQVDISTLETQKQPVAVSGEHGFRSGAHQIERIMLLPARPSPAAQLAREQPVRQFPVSEPDFEVSDYEIATHEVTALLPLQVAVTPRSGSGWSKEVNFPISRRFWSNKRIRPTVTASSWKKRLSLVARALLTCLLFGALGRSVSWGDLLGALAHLRHSVALVALAVGLLSLVASAYQWRFLLRSECIQFDLAELLDLYLIGIAFSHFLPTGIGGDAIKALQTGRGSGNQEGSISAVVMSRLTGFLGMLVLAYITLLIWHTSFSALLQLWFGALCLLVGGLIGAVLLIALFLPGLLRKRWAGLRFLDSALRLARTLRIAIRRPRALFLATLFGLIFWIIACLNYYSYADALSMQVPLYFYFVAIPFISLVTFLPVSINGYGLREGAVIYLFASLHVPPSTALALALLVDAQGLLFGLIGGCLYLIRGGLRGRHARLHHLA